jgi:hypothetical protein
LKTEPIEPSRSARLRRVNMHEPFDGLRDDRTGDDYLLTAQICNTPRKSSSLPRRRYLIRNFVMQICFNLVAVDQ